MRAHRTAIESNRSVWQNGGERTDDDHQQKRAKNEQNKKKMKWKKRQRRGKLRDEGKSSANNIEKRVFIRDAARHHWQCAVSLVLRKSGNSQTISSKTNESENIEKKREKQWQQHQRRMMALSRFYHFIGIAFFTLEMLQR